MKNLIIIFLVFPVLALAQTDPALEAAQKKLEAETLPVLKPT